MSSSPNPPIPPIDRNKPAKGGMGGILAAILAVVCVILAIVAISAVNAKGELQKNLAAAQEEASKAKGDVGELRKALDQTKADEAIYYLRVSMLPPDLQGRPFEAAQKIRKLYDDSKGTSMQPVPVAAGAPGTHPASVAAGPADAANVQLENVARTVMHTAFNTKTPVDHDAAKEQMHKSIQIVLTRIGAFHKPVTGNQKDTLEAVVAFQKANGLKPDGIVGKGTWGKVREKFNALAKQ